MKLQGRAQRSFSPWLDPPARHPSLGQSLVEFAIVLPVFILVLVAVMDFGFMLFARMTVINAAREGAQYGSSLKATQWTSMATLVTSHLDNDTALPGLTTSNLTINVTCYVPDTTKNPATWTLCSGCTKTSCSSWPSSGLQGDAVQVAVTYPYTPFFPLFFGNTINFSATDQMVIYPPPTS